MPTQHLQNRQALVPFVLENGDDVEILGTTMDADPPYVEGLSVNGGSRLHVEIDLSTVTSVSTVTFFRRLTRHDPWAQFDMQTPAKNAPWSHTPPSIAGFSDVRAVCTTTDPGPFAITVSASISTLP